MITQSQQLSISILHWLPKNACERSHLPFSKVRRWARHFFNHKSRWITPLSREDKFLIFLRLSILRRKLRPKVTSIFSTRYKTLMPYFLEIKFSINKYKPCHLLAFSKKRWLGWRTWSSKTIFLLILVEMIEMISNLFTINKKINTNTQPPQSFLHHLNFFIVPPVNYTMTTTAW
jgi:hypothetical protein